MASIETPSQNGNTIDSNSNSNEKPSKITIFFKVRESVKKAVFPGNTMNELKELFFEKFESFNNKDRVLPPFYIIDPQSKISHELENLEDIYPNCVLEIKLPKLDVIDKKEMGYGYFSAFQRHKLVFVMVGLPARGKTYIARKITRYLKWVGVPTRLFNVGNYRRERLGAEQSFEFFDPSNVQGNRQRLHMAIAALDDMLSWLEQGGRVAIYDATNSTRERRSMILKRCNQSMVQTVFVESVCSDPIIIEKNVRETKLSSPDYAKYKEPEDAVKDFKLRIEQYAKTYEPMDEADNELSYVKLIDVGRQIIINRIDSYLPSRVIHFLMNLHITPRPIWLTRHGQSEDNVHDRIGGDSNLTNKGDQYAHMLADWVETNLNGLDLVVWTSTLKRSIATAQYINHNKVSLRALDEIDAGICEGLTYDEMANTLPEEYAARAANKLKYRYPHGESYIDVIQRLEPVLFEIERQKTPILIVAHQAILRALYGYFMDIDAEEVPYIPIQMHTVYQLIPKAYGCEVKTFKIC
mmetsp:Transcript_2067/g.2726  ORF Transcript_2067/g.2726 Transcript_2067/m.2726 type:complete len:524 (+) Transcript_2067:60-1631(+)